MNILKHTIVIRHRRENLKKCSLRGLEKRNDFTFLTYPFRSLPSLEGYFLLSFDGPQLSAEDHAQGLLVLDGTWKYAAVMEKALQLPPSFPRRSLPHLQTAYPRRQEDCPEPVRGLASLEAIFTAYALLGRDTAGLLDNYYWKEEFLKKNASLFSHIL